MRPGQQNKRGRGRNNNNNGGGGGGGNFNRKGANPLTRTYDSSGPDVKIRGTAQHIAEKYSTLARDAHSAGDRVMAENYLQHAEHYNRIIAAAQAQMQDRFQRDDREDRGEFNDRDYNDRDDDMDGGDEPQSNHQSMHQSGNQANHQSGNQANAAPVQNQAPAAPAREPRPAPVPRPPREPRPAPVIAGSGPQPIIEDVPVPAVEVEGTEEQAAERQPRRRNPAARPRRQPRRANAAAEGGEEGANAGQDGAEQPAGEKPALVDASE